MNNKAFGSGYFGEWISGEYNLPAYKYTCNQLIDDKAVTQTNTAWKGKREHTFSLGNDRIVITASNYGYCQVRQDEGTPKYLTDYDEKNHQYGGGFGYLISENEKLSTYYNGSDMLREYGAGYFKKVVSSDKSCVEQLLFAPYGDDPVVINRIKITNKTNAERAYKWYEYWAGEMYQFSFTHYIVAQLTFNTANVSRLRRRFARTFIKEYQIGSQGLSKKWTYSNKGIFTKAINKISEGILKKSSKRFYDVSTAHSVDYNPPTVNLISLSGRNVGILTNATQFFGKGGVTDPDGLKNTSIKTKEKNSMMMLIEDVIIPGNDSIILTYAYMYIPEGYNSQVLTDKYKNSDINELFKDSCNKWANERVKVKIKGMEWLDNELLWHNAYLRGNMTYSSFYGNHILSQGGHYQYLLGLQGAPRDQLQHSLPFIYTEPWIAREHILFTLKQLSPLGELPYATTGEGLLIAMIMIPSDLQFMLLSFISEYVLANRDKAFLNTSYDVIFDGRKVTRTVKEGVLLAYKYATENVGKGPHGLIRMKTGDWNDQAVYGRVPLSQTKVVHKIGESMLNSAMAVYSFDIFGKMLEFSGDIAESQDSFRWSAEIKEAVRAQWNGKWFRRAWMGDKVGWLGDDLLWLEPQPFAIISDCTTKEQAQILADNINEKLCKPNPNGAQLISFNEIKQEKSAGLEVGVQENGGIWPAINGYLVWALAKVDGKFAWNEWLRNTRAYEAEAYPDIWYGIWSGPDSINSTCARYPGRTQSSKNPVTGKREKFFKLTVGVDWEDYPALNLHAHTWQQYIIFKLLGLEFNSSGLIINPVIPIDMYSVSSGLFSLSYNKNIYFAEYNPIENNKILIEFDLRGRIAEELTVNGIKTEIFINTSNRLEFKAEGLNIKFEIKLK